MLKKSYTNFVKASSVVDCQNINNGTISGDEARRIYLEEVRDSRQPPPIKTRGPPRKRANRTQEISVSNKDLFLMVQSNDIDTLRSVLDSYPDKINVVDEYGWSLLMIACQANSVDIVKELLNRGIDMSIRDKAGNSARSLVIKNKNYLLADVLLNYKEETRVAPEDVKQTDDDIKAKRKEEYFCEFCNKKFEDKEEHLSSTLHNISASRGKKIPTRYAIPQTNRGFQIMLKVGWDKDSGLGRDGTGKKYPIKVVKKEDRKGLGHEKRKQGEQTVENDVKHINRRKLVKQYHSNRRFEINFRREFY